MDINATKRCSRCKEVQDLNLFGLDSTQPDGHSCYCKPCKRKLLAKPTPVPCSSCPEIFLERQDTVNSKKRAGKLFICPKCREAARPTEEEKKATKVAGWTRYYSKYKQVVIDRSADRRQESRQYLCSIKEGSPCKDCGKHYPHYVMEFDHVRGEKFDDLSTLAGRGYTKESIDAEIAKCELVCANCHRERTFSRRRITSNNTQGLA